MENINNHNTDRRRIYIYDEITSRTSRIFLKQSHYLMDCNKNPITVYINSEGGSLVDALCIIDEIRNLEQDGISVYTVNVGAAYSAAALILAHGTNGCRLARNYSTVMLHPCAYGLSEDYAENQVKTQQFLKKITDRYNKTLSNACNQKNFTKFMKDISKGLWLDAEGAIKYGVIDKII